MVSVMVVIPPRSAHTHEQVAHDEADKRVPAMGAAELQMQYVVAEERDLDEYE